MPFAVAPRFAGLTVGIVLLPISRIALQFYGRIGVHEYERLAAE